MPDVWPQDPACIERFKRAVSTYCQAGKPLEIKHVPELVDFMISNSCGRGLFLGILSVMPLRIVQRVQVDIVGALSARATLR
jgi:hypothetical protein